MNQPEFGGVHNVYKYYQQIQQPIPDLLIPAPPLSHDTHKDYRVQDDRAKLLEKINQDSELRVLERPELPEKEKQEPPLRAPELPGVSEPVLAPPNKLPSAPTITNGEDSDPETRARRIKSKSRIDVHPNQLACRVYLEGQPTRLKSKYLEA
ncbi:uncharacterized protein LOC113371223 [Ctenocephalides felis]|uniref:uncharacterized protein LOC113371223 n=1 Tax=Ctenocephalides felis TaxID=7515 RepID=UPI000E6E181C|nr:uncharacterized protein LOC113371223 [Ctenocephalides felis]